MNVLSMQSHIDIWQLSSQCKPRACSMKYLFALVSTQYWNGTGGAAGRLRRTPRTRTRTRVRSSLLYQSYHGVYPNLEQTAAISSSLNVQSCLQSPQKSHPHALSYLLRTYSLTSQRPTSSFVLTTHMSFAYSSFISSIALQYSERKF